MDKCQFESAASSRAPCLEVLSAFVRANHILLQSDWKYQPRDNHNVWLPSHSREYTSLGLCDKRVRCRFRRGNVDVSCAELGYATLIFLARDLIYVVFGAGCGLTGRAGGELELHVRQWVVCKEDGLAGCVAVGDTAGRCSRVRENGCFGRCDATLVWEGAMQQTLHFICEQRSAADEVSGAVADCGGDKAARCRDAASLFLRRLQYMNNRLFLVQSCAPYLTLYKP